MTAHDWQAIAVVGGGTLAAAIVLLSLGKLVDLIERRRARHRTARWVEEGEDW